MLALALALVAFAGWGVGDIFGTVATRRIGSYGTTFLIYLASLILLSFYIPFALIHLPVSDIGFCIFLGIMQFLAYWAFNEGLRSGNASIVSTIAGSFPALVVLLSTVFLHQPLSLLQLAVIGLIILGVMLTSLDFKTINKGKVKFDRSIIFALLAMSGWGFYFAFVKVPIGHIGWFWPDYIGTVAGVMVLLSLTMRRVKESTSSWRGGIRIGLITGAFTGIATLAFNGALASGNTNVVAPIAGAYPVLYVFLASLVFREPTSTTQRCGIALALGGIVGLALVGQ